MSRVIPNNREKFFKDDEIIVSKTDLKGRITYGNELFIKMSGYEERELLGKPHNLIRHPDMPKVVFKLLWDTLQSGKEIFAYVKNLAKDGSFYWVFANVTASKDLNGDVIGYYSVRRTPEKETIKLIDGLYKQLVQIEKSEGIQGSEKALNDLLKEKGLTYAKFILSC